MSAPFSGGPYVQFACLCEEARVDERGRLSLLNIVGISRLKLGGPVVPEEMPPIQSCYDLVVMFYSGAARGRSDLRIVFERPDGSSQSFGTQTVYFQGEEHADGYNTRLTVDLPMEGLYWFKVYLDDEKMTAVPLRVQYEREVDATGEIWPAPTLPPEGS